MAKTKKDPSGLSKPELKRRARLYATRYEYRNIFGKGTNLRERIDAILEGHADPAPNTSGSELLEQMFYALSRGKPNPLPLNKLKGNHQEEVDSDADENKPTLVKRIHEAMAALFLIPIQRQPLK